jgi:L-ascorbate metabolism protein UlaG (beta-lactamase superfamily)
MMSRRMFMLATLAQGAGLATLAAPSGTGEPRLLVQRLGWAGIRLQLGAASLYIDPLVDPKVWGAALTEPLIAIDGGGDSRFVLITHRHPDHCDPVAIRQLVGSNGALVSTTASGFCTVPSELRVRVGSLYEPLLLGDFTAAAVPAVDGYGDPQVSWVVTAGGRRIIHCGDTMWHGFWWQIGRQYGPFDAAFLPINGARFGWRHPVSDQPAVMTPDQAVAAAVILGARCLVPIHYGMAASQAYTEVTNAEGQLRAEAKRRSIKVQILQPGAWLPWD